MDINGNCELPERKPNDETKLFLTSMELYFPLVSFTPGEVRRSQCLGTGPVGAARKSRQPAGRVGRHTPIIISLSTSYRRVAACRFPRLAAARLRLCRAEENGEAEAQKFPHVTAKIFSRQEFFFRTSGNFFPHVTPKISARREILLRTSGNFSVTKTTVTKLKTKQLNNKTI